MRIPKIKMARLSPAGEHQPCVVCGLPVQSPRFMVECVNGGTDECVMPGTAAADDGYMGFFPVGQDCLRNHPELRDYVVKV